MTIRRRILRAILLALVALPLLLAGLPGAAQGLPLSPPMGGDFHKVMADSRDTTAAALAQTGATRIADYGAFALWRVPSGEIAAALTLPGITTYDRGDTIWLRGRTIDTAAAQCSGADPAADLPAGLRQTRTVGAQLWLVQFAGPVQDAWLDELRGLDLAVVAYMPENAYVVWGDGAGLDKLDALAAEGRAVQWAGAYHPGYRLAPELRSLDFRGFPNLEGLSAVDVTVQFYNTPGLDRSLAALQTLGGRVYKGPETVLDLTDLSLQLPAARLKEVAAWPDVFNVEPWATPAKLDEVQGQILAGNLIKSGSNFVPSGPGYLAWLASKGFPTTPASYPVVDIVDDGIDQGNASNVLHPDFHELGVLANPDRIVYIGNCTADATGNGVAGHGNLNAGIVGAYNNLSGWPYADGNGYHIGLGISPYGRIAGTKIFKNAGSYDISVCGYSDAGVVAASFNAGATFTSNSWGDSFAAGAYDASAQAYDTLTRDASAATPGNQEMLHIFAAGNDGSGANTVGSPGTAKNVMTVAATENVRDQGVADGCNLSSANNADDIASFSSRGPTDDSRVKPDIAAPGTHVQGPASQDPGYDGSDVCGGSPNPPNKYYPSGQTLYTWSSGTSHSTPAVAGAASLTYEYYGRILAPGHTPSPAMLKALLINSARYLTGVSANDTLPSNNQGWGDANLGTLTDGTSRYLVDQSVIFGASGQAHTLTASVTDGGKPVRVTLAWTDAPGSTTGNAYVNDLDLEVTAGGQTYKGNVFSGANSIAGGAADPRNNVENVFLPAGGSGSLMVRVIARNIAGDGVPGNADLTDQDFALVLYNANYLPQPILQAAGIRTAQGAGNGDGVVDPGETFTVDAGLSNVGLAPATGIIGTLSVTGGDATLADDAAAYSDAGIGATVTNTVPYTFTVGLAQACGAPITFRQVVTYNTSLTLTQNFSVATGATQIGATQNYTYTGAPVSIPDHNTAGASASIAISATGAVADVNARVTINHTWDGDLSLYLISPAGTTVSLALRRGGSGDNFTGTVFDDEAAQAISAGSAPFAGQFRPETPLSALDGQPISGTWTLKAVDAASYDTGSIRAVALEIQSLTYRCTPYAPAPVAPVVSIAQTGGDVVLRWLHAPANATYEVWQSAAPYFTPGGVGATVIAHGAAPECTNADGAITCTDAGAIGADYAYVVRAANALGAWADSNRVGKFEFDIIPGD
ncbi:MAG: S8 family serine peptidase [Chloroflexi bacterium]|nr:S8 family serine peptidase [Chloroflexota bacterium]